MLLVEDDYELLFCSTPSPLAPIRKFVPTNARPATPKDIFLYHSKKSHSLLGPGMSLNNASWSCSHFLHTWSRRCSKMLDELKLISSYACINYDIWEQTVLSIHACVSKDYVCISLSLSLFLSISGFSKLQVCICKSFAHVYQYLHFAWITFFVNYEFQNCQQLIFQIILWSIWW